MFFLAEDIFRKGYTLGMEWKCLVVATLCDHVKTVGYELIKILFLYATHVLVFFLKLFLF